MRKRLAKLLSIASGALAPSPVDRPSLLVGAHGAELWALLTARNGFYAFERALHVFPSGGPGVQTLEHWNAPDAWRSHYRDLADGCVFFAEDVFGGQFVLKGEAIHTFDPETGETEQIAADLEAWAGAILDDYALLTGHRLASAWQAEHGALPPGQRLLPRTPFVIGGAFELTNLYAADAVKGMQFRGDFAIQIRDVPEGEQLGLEVVE
jgi:hypothetical protein